MNFAEGSRVLFVGEGDFSFVASLSQQGLCAGIHLTATSLQEQQSERARSNVEVLVERGVKVVLGVDATRLHLHPVIRHLRFTHIVFNFPHVGGKMRIDLNRKLLREFFQSAVEVLECGGHVVVTLCGGQAGVPPDPVVRRWDDSWKVVLMASYADLVLRSIQKFSPDSFPGYTATGYRSLEKTFCQDGALMFMFQVCELSPEPLDAEATESVLLCDGCSIKLPAFLHSQLQMDIMSDKSSFAGYLYSWVVGLLSANLTVYCQETLVFRKETQCMSLGKCETVSICKDQRECTIFCHPSYRINEESLQLEPLVILFYSGDTEMLESVLSQSVTLNVRNVSHSFTPVARQLAVRDFTDQMCFSDDQSCAGSVVCCVVSVAALARHCGVEEDEVWALGQSVSLCGDVLTFTQWSLCPVEYIYDLSFWDSIASGGENNALVSGTLNMTIDTIITNMGRGTVKSYRLLSSYSHPVLGRRSHTYRIEYRSWHGALSDQGAKQVHSQIGQQLEKCLGVEVR
ncbi:uncharacterized protein LOC135094256 isoform X1 [Scylla paramamosain]|uniref:uncharacterized protein LOC135094256 isoform X1 n=1 Tax=Scylla paramamosain TaxID=85552 RepID=UPI003083CBFF